MTRRPAPTPNAFRRTVSRFATGVTVMTTVSDGGPHGMTANAVSSVSLDPLLVLVCVERSTVMIDAVQEAGFFALSVLAAAQADLSEHFADPARPMGQDQFEGVGVHAGVTGAPFLDGAVAAIDCRVWATYDGGDHLIVVGEVVDLEVGDDADALVYFRSAYNAVSP